ncbi:unnamed protein product [Enterobius vermicularis]|uniref:Secreted protein n=1 Tax=Enterobius vermicularis TaxID=51028 RepID=A0A0N4VL60_ENTVE|nr:unnamed protein product [Enterobius vermicularis]
MVERAVAKTMKKRQLLLRGALLFTCLKLRRWDVVATTSCEDHFLLDDRFEQSSEIEIALLKEKQDFESQIPLKMSRIDELQKSFSDISGRLNKIWFVDVSLEVTSGV